MHHAIPGHGYPRVYRPGRLWRYGFPILGAVAIVGGALGAWALGRPLSGIAQLIVSPMFGLLSLAGVYLILYARRMRVIVRQDEIELVEVTSSQIMRRDDLLGYRKIPGENGPPVLILVPRWDDRKKLKIPNVFNFDAAFDEWLRPFPDLDVRDAEDLQREIEQNQELGATPEERIASVNQARVVCRTLMIVTFAVAAWLWFYPEPYAVVVSAMALLPWIAVYVAAHYRGVVVINEKKRDPHPGVGLPFIMPGLVLALRVINDVNTFNWQKPLIVTLLGGAVLTMGAWKADVAVRKKPWMALLIFLLSLGYGYGAGMEANSLLDRSPATVYLTTVTAKRISSGSKSTSYYLRLNAWGQQHRGEVMVPRSTYQSVIVGDPICVVQRAGALDIPWYAVHSCRQ